MATIIVAVLAIISLVTGGFLGTFRHRAYGVWSLAGVLIAITTANIIGTSIGIWMASSIGSTEITPVLVLVKTSVLVIVSLIISYYASDLLPAQHDPKTRSDNIKAGSLGVFNAYLIIATILVYVQGLNNDFSASLFGDGQSFNFNRMFIDGLPWLTSVLVLYIVGWSSVRKFMQAWAKLRGTSNTTPPASTGSTTAGTNYSYTPPSGGFNPSYSPSSSASAVPPANESTEKKGWLSGIGEWFRREEKPSDSDMGGTNASVTTQAPVQPTYSTSTYQGTSGATPPYGIATGSTGYTPNYSNAPSTGSNYTAAPTSYTAPSSYGSSYNSTPTPAAPTTGYSSTTSYTPAAPTTGYSSTTSYTPPSSSPSYPSSYGSTPVSSSPSYPSSYSSPSSATPSTYNSGVTSGFTPSSPPSTTDAAVGGLVAGGLFGATFANPATSGGFGDMNAYQDADEDDAYFDEDEDDDSQDSYPSGYRG
ncbi:MAG: hypothetical protein RI985_894 [Chloroflexota bacterium]|jgi:hypothetical protein